MPTLGHVLVHETSEMYNSVVKPYIQSIVDGGSLGWITNIIQLKKEKERLLFNNDEFVIHVDTKWRTHPPPLKIPREEWLNHPSVEDLYCLAITKLPGIASLRDLRGEHIPMLQSMINEGLKVVKSTYGVDHNQIRIFVHYQPQFYHFHVHYTRLENEVGCCCERGHLLSDVIQNLEIDSEFYCKRTISYKLKRGTPLENIVGTFMEAES
jgi:m7GpppX diphosphatase